MIRNIIGIILILISCAILVINQAYLEPNGLKVIPYWILVVCAVLGGFIPDYESKKREITNTLIVRNVSINLFIISYSAIGRFS